MNQQFLKSGCAAILFACVWGCSDSHEQAGSLPMSSCLVFPTEEMADEGRLHPLDYSRNDFRLGGLPDDDLVSIRVAEVRQREWLWISNGQSREHSSVLTRSIKRGIAP